MDLDTLPANPNSITLRMALNRLDDPTPRAPQAAAHARDERRPQRPDALPPVRGVLHGEVDGRPGDGSALAEALRVGREV